MSEQKSEQRQRGSEDWSSLVRYSILLFSVGVLTGYFATLCPSRDGPRWAQVTMYICYGFLWLFTLACFAAIGFRLKEKQSQ